MRNPFGPSLRAPLVWAALASPVAACGAEAALGAVGASADGDAAFYGDAGGPGAADSAGGAPGDGAATGGNGGNGSSAPDGGAEPDDAAAADTAKGGPGDGETPDAGGGGWLDGPAPRGELLGAVAVFEIDTGSADLDRGNAVAHFGPPEPPPEADARFGPCDVLPQAPNLEPQPHPGADAGTITITGAAIPVELTWSAYDATYASSVPASNAAILAKPDTPIQVSATGGAHVPPFSGSVATPAPVELLSPTLGLTAQVATTEPLPLSWTQDSPGKVTRTVVALAPVGFDFKPIKGAAIVCAVPGDPGALTVPADAMAALPSTFGTRLVVSVTRTVETTVDAGGVPVTLAATATYGGVATAK